MHGPSLAHYHSQAPEHCSDPDHQLPLREKSSSVVTKIMFRLSRMTIRWLLLPAFCKRSSENQSKVPQVSLVQLCVTAPGDGFMKQKPVLPVALRCQDHSQPLWSSTRYPFRDETLPTSSLLMDPLHQQVYQKWGFGDLASEGVTLRWSPAMCEGPHMQLSNQLGDQPL